MQSSFLVALGIGTNIEPRLEYLTDAIREITNVKGIERIVSISGIYETEPVGYTDQAAFLNQVLFLETTREPYALLDELQKIELELGRVRLIRWGPRTIDLDILLYEGVQMDKERLTIPHPRMHERSFVGIPFQDAFQKLEASEQQRIGKVVLNLSPDGVKCFSKREN